MILKQIDTHHSFLQAPLNESDVSFTSNYRLYSVVCKLILVPWWLKPRPR